MASKHEFHKGDSLDERPKGQRVQWSSGQGTATGTVQSRITEDKTVDGSKVSASKDDPRYLVENENTGTVTGHRPDVLSKADSESSDSSSSSSSSSSGSSNSDKFKAGDHVQWSTSQGKTTGTIKKKLTSETDIKGYTAQASEDDPQYLVKSDSTGEEAAHKPDALEMAD